MKSFRTGLKGAFDGSQLPFSFTLTHVSGVGAASVEVQSPVPSKEKVGAPLV